MGCRKGGSDVGEGEGGKKHREEKLHTKNTFTKITMINDGLNENCHNDR